MSDGKAIKLNTISLNFQVSRVFKNNEIIFI